MHISLHGKSLKPAKRCLNRSHTILFKIERERDNQNFSSFTLLKMLYFHL